MAEIETVVDSESLGYEGYFSVRELYALVNRWLSQNGYDRIEANNSEVVQEHGKEISIFLWPYKKVSDYAKLEIRMFLTMSGVKDVKVKIRNQEVLCNEGKLNLTFDGLMVTDYEGKFASTPLLFFFRTFFDKYIFKTQTGSYENLLKKDIRRLKAEIKSFLNFYKVQ